MPPRQHFDCQIKLKAAETFTCANLLSIQFSSVVPICFPGLTPLHVQTFFQSSSVQLFPYVSATTIANIIIITTSIIVLDNNITITITITITIIHNTNATTMTTTTTTTITRITITTTTTNIILLLLLILPCLTKRCSSELFNTREET